MTAAPLLTVAHRAGNRPDTLREALDAGVDLVEADVHRFRRALEVRHWKTLGPRLFWERWELATRRAVAPPDLTEILAAAHDGARDGAHDGDRTQDPGGDRGDARLLLDLKGVHPGLAPAVAACLRDAAPGVPVAVCTQHWWMVAAFAADPQVRVILSAGSRLGVRRLRARLARRRDRPPVFGVSVHLRLLTPALVADLRRAAGHVLTWPVDTPAALAAARRLGVSGVTSKSLPLLREVAAAR
jgi:hypothetical protein